MSCLIQCIAYSFFVNIWEISESENSFKVNLKPFLVYAYVLSWNNTLVQYSCTLRYYKEYHGIIIRLCQFHNYIIIIIGKSQIYFIFCKCDFSALKAMFRIPYTVKFEKTLTSYHNQLMGSPKKFKYAFDKGRN